MLLSDPTGTSYSTGQHGKSQFISFPRNQVENTPVWIKDQLFMSDNKGDAASNGNDTAKSMPPQKPAAINKITTRPNPAHESVQRPLFLRSNTSSGVRILSANNTCSKSDGESPPLSNGGMILVRPTGDVIDSGSEDSTNTNSALASTPRRAISGNVRPDADQEIKTLATTAMAGSTDIEVAKVPPSPLPPYTNTSSRTQNTSTKEFHSTSNREIDVATLDKSEDGDDIYMNETVINGKENNKEQIIIPTEPIMLSGIGSKMMFENFSDQLPHAPFLQFPVDLDEGSNNYDNRTPDFVNEFATKADFKRYQQLRRQLSIGEKLKKVPHFLMRLKIFRRESNGPASPHT